VEKSKAPVSAGADTGRDWESDIVNRLNRSTYLLGIKSP